jgi:hypothetical protein
MRVKPTIVQKEIRLQTQTVISDSASSTANQPLHLTVRLKHEDRIACAHVLYDGIVRNSDSTPSLLIRPLQFGHQQIARASRNDLQLSLSLLGGKSLEF